MSLKPSSFYGQSSSRDAKRKRNLSLAESSVSKKRVSDVLATTSSSQSILKSTPVVYKVFSKQSDALDFSKCFSGDLKVFAFETDANGRRNFVVCHPERFWTLYDAKEASARHDYEVIEENVPCKLYLDIEFKKKLNPETEGETLMKSFKHLLVTFVKQTFDIDLVDADFVDLDSSTDDKFSRHFIVKNVVFKNNYHAGNFVRQFCAKLEEDPANLVRMSEKEEELGVFVDRGVYTKNRNFRLYLSSKFGKTATLKLARNCSRKAVAKMNEKEIFLAALVTYGTSQRQLLTFGSDVSTTSLKVASTRTSLTSLSSLSKSPFPEIDEFFRDLISDDGGYIRKWFISGSQLYYEISGGYRYCSNVSRHHKSNNVRFDVDLNFGLYVQSCHDPDCKNFRSPSTILPPETMPWLSIDDDDDFENVASVANDGDKDVVRRDDVFDDGADEFLLLASESIL